MLIVATPVLLLALWAIRLSLKVSNFFPISLIILFMFLAHKAKMLEKHALIVARMLEKYALIVLPSNSVDDCSFWQFDGP